MTKQQVGVYLSWGVWGTRGNLDLDVRQIESLSENV